MRATIQSMGRPEGVQAGRGEGHRLATRSLPFLALCSPATSNDIRPQIFRHKLVRAQINPRAGHPDLAGHVSHRDGAAFIVSVFRHTTSPSRIPSVTINILIISVYISRYDQNVDRNKETPRAPGRPVVVRHIGRLRSPQPGLGSDCRSDSTSGRRLIDSRRVSADLRWPAGGALAGPGAPRSGHRRLWAPHFRGTMCRDSSGRNQDRRLFRHPGCWLGIARLGPEPGSQSHAPAPAQDRL